MSEHNNKVDTTNRCEALKVVMSLNYVKYLHISLPNTSISKIQNISDILKCFIYDMSNTLDIADIIKFNILIFTLKYF